MVAPDSVDGRPDPAARRTPGAWAGASRLPRTTSRPLWAWISIGLTVALLIWPVSQRTWNAAEATFLVSAVALLIAAWILLARPGQRSNGGLMLVLALVATTQDSFSHFGSGPWPVLSYLLLPLIVLPFGLLMLRWPRTRLQMKPERGAVGYACVSIPLLQVLDIVSYDPAWSGYTGPAWWPTLVPDERLNQVLYQVGRGNLAVLAAVWLVLIALRVRRAAPAERRVLVPVVLAAALAGGSYAADAAALAITSLPLVSEVLLNLSLLVLPLSLLLSLTVRRIQRALAVEALLQPQRLRDSESVRLALARVLGDRDLTLFLWSPERHTYLTPDGHEATDEISRRHPVEIVAPEGAPVARLGIDPRLADDNDLLEAVARAAGVALDNARLQAELRARQREAAESSSRLLHARDVERSLSRLIPGGLADRLRVDPTVVTRTERHIVSVLMSDVRGYSTIAEHAPPAELAEQLNDHRRAMNGAILAEGGTVMQYVGDAVLAVFGAPDPQPDHATRALRAAAEMHRAQQQLNAEWSEKGRPPFGLGIGICTGEVAAAFLGSDERLEYTVVGDTVNLAARLCDLARPAGTTVASATTMAGLEVRGSVQPLPALQVKGRVATVSAYRVIDPAYQDVTTSVPSDPPKPSTAAGRTARR